MQLVISHTRNKNYLSTMDELKLLRGVFMAACPEQSGTENTRNRDKRVQLFSVTNDPYIEWEFVRIEEDKARCICGMPAKKGRSVVLRHAFSSTAIYVGSHCIKYFPRVDSSLLDNTTDGYSREDGFVVDDDNTTSSDSDSDPDEDDNSEHDEHDEHDDCRKQQSVPVSRVYNFRRRPRRFLKYEDEDEDKDEDEDNLQPANKKLRRLVPKSTNTTDEQDQASRTQSACQDFFLRPKHTVIEERVFLGYLKSLYPTPPTPRQGTNSSNYLTN